MSHSITQPVHIKIFGERNTSTNALKSSIERNSESIVLPSTLVGVDGKAARQVDLLHKLRAPSRIIEKRIDWTFEKQPPEFSWKHAATRFDDVSCFQNTNVILCIRHPASWLLALYKRPYHLLNSLPSTFHEFLKKPWITTKRERLDRGRMSPIALYNTKLQYNLKFIRQLEEEGINIQIMHFEQFAQDQLGCLEKLKPLLHKPAESFSILQRSTKDSGKNADYYKHYYGNALWAKEIDPTAHVHINDNIDWSIAGEFDYQPMTV